jgi:signal transduction histidine kinase
VIVSGLAIAGATLAVGLVLAYLLQSLPTVRIQLAALAALAVGLPLASVLLSGWVMFHMGDDVKILAVSATAAAVAVVAGLFLAETVVRPLERVRESAAQLARGDLSARAREDGPREIAELSVSFNEMAGNIERLFDARRELVSWASHDLRAPLANMRAMLEATEDKLVAPDYYVPALHEQVRALSLLVDDMFELAQIDAGTLTVELREWPLGDLVRACLQGVEAEARSCGIRLHADVDGPANAQLAPDKIERVLLNLLTNAIRHTPMDGTVAVIVHSDDHTVQVTVEDTGEGIDEEARTRMFERFWRGDRARSSRQAGLGLAISRGLIEAHGGQIWADHRPGGGTRVSFTLPTGRPAHAQLIRPSSL